MNSKIKLKPKQSALCRPPQYLRQEILLTVCCRFASLSYLQKCIPIINNGVKRQLSHGRIWLLTPAWERSKSDFLWFARADPLNPRPCCFSASWVEPSAAAVRRCCIAAASELVFCPEDWHFYLFLGEDMLLCTLNYCSLSLNPFRSVPPQVYLYLRPSLSKPKNVHAISKLPPSLLRDCPPPHTVHLAFLLAPFFIDSFYFTPLCCRQLLLSTAPKFSLRSQPSVPVRGEKFFFFF